MLLDEERKQPKSADVSAEQTSNVLVKRIRKLRWMGMEEEAKRLQNELALTHSTDPVIGGPPDTD